MSLVLKSGVLACLSSLAITALAADQQTIIFVRHGEKPAQGLGQLNCQGLNRALALPAIVIAKFGKPDFVIASNPAEKKTDGNASYNYVRPLLTVAPTAIQLGLPIKTAYGFEDIDGLQKELALPQYRNAVVLVGWEHKMLEDAVKGMLKNMGGAKGVVPHWKGSDFDSMYVLKIERSGGQVSAKFSVEHEQLDGLPASCPSATKP